MAYKANMMNMEKTAKIPKIDFSAYGHKNIKAAHYNTLEFIKDKEITQKGDCIVGVRCDYDIEGLKGLKEKVKIILSIDSIKDELFAEVNPDFGDQKEMVIRKSQFRDRRTFAINASKSAKDINREIIAKMKDPKSTLHITVEEIQS